MNYIHEQATLWANTLGMLPINLLPLQTDDVAKYALLNGYSNNFCLTFSEDVDVQTAKSRAWSSNMANYVNVNGDNLCLFSLNKGEPERIPYNYVFQNLPRFFDYLGQNQIEAQKGIIPYVMKYYRMVRNAMREEGTAGNALKVFLYMLAHLENKGAEKWKLPEGANELALSIGNQLFEQVYQSFHKGLKDFQIVPNVQLLIRHSAGMLFQEANYVARFSNQLELFPTETIRYEMSPKMMGSYFTPAYIARTIVEEALRHAHIEEKSSLTIFDPACGSGVFLVEVLHQLRTLHYRGNIDIIGWDIDPVAIDMVDFVLQFEKREWKDKLQYKVKTVNSMLAENVWPSSDLILMNPPYNSWNNMSDEQREQANAVMNTSIRPNMASVFYYRAAHSLKENGVIGSLMPTSFLTADSHASIRRATNILARPRLICNLGNFVFTSAMTDVSIIVSSNREDFKPVQMLWTKNVDDVTPVALRSLRRENNNPMISFASGKDYSIYYDDYASLMTRDNWMPLQADSLRLLSFIEERMKIGGLKRAEDIFDIRMGARTGINSVFIISKEEYKRIPNSERTYFRPSVDSASLHDGVLTPTNYLFYPYPENEKGFENETELKEKIPFIYQHFFKDKLDLLINRQLRNGKWWQLSRPGAWQFYPLAKIVSTEFGRAGSFAYDGKGEFVVERGMAWILDDKSAIEEKYYFYLAIFNSRFFNSLLQIYAHQLAGGEFYNLEGKYVRSIPLPIYNAIDESTKEALITYGHRISKEGYKDVEGLTKIVRGVYGK